MDVEVRGLTVAKGNFNWLKTKVDRRPKIKNLYLYLLNMI